MKTIIALFSIAMILSSCATQKLPPDTVVVYWEGKSTLVTIKDSTGAYYQPVYLKHK